MLQRHHTLLLRAHAFDIPSFSLLCA
jgi:hypothetical protein